MSARRRASAHRCPGCDSPVTPGAAGTSEVQAWSKRTTYGTSGLATMTSDIRVPRTWHTTCLTEANARHEEHRRRCALDNVRTVISIARATGLGVEAVITARREVGNDTVTDDEIRALWAEEG